MKKLMILAAAAAMSGVTLADNGYQFTATLKTTKAKKGTDIITTIKLGKNAAGEFWYTDADYTTITNTASGYWSAKKPMVGASAPVPTVKKAKTKDGTTPDKAGAYLLYADGTTATAADYANVVALLKKLGKTGMYDQQSAGQWCEVVKVIDPAQCYRVAGTKKIDLKFKENDHVVDCCTDIGAALTFVAPAATNIADSVSDTAVSTVYLNNDGAIAYQTNQVAALSAISTLYQRFGSQENSKANRLEMYAAVPYALTTDGYLFAGWIAGQGTAFARDGMAANTISGNIVGVVEAPECEYCCSPSTASVAFDCLNETSPALLPYSAAYGTFRLRYVRNVNW